MPPLFWRSAGTMLWFRNAVTVDHVGSIWPDYTIGFIPYFPFFTAQHSTIKTPFLPNSFPIWWDMFLSQLKIDWSRGVSADMASAAELIVFDWSLLLCIINNDYYYYYFHCWYYHYCFQLVKWSVSQVLIIVYYAGGWRLHQPKDLLLDTREK